MQYERGLFQGYSDVDLMELTTVQDETERWKAPRNTQVAQGQLVPLWSVRFQKGLYCVLFNEIAPNKVDDLKSDRESYAIFRVFNN